MPANLASAGGIVGNGNFRTCTEAALDAALAGGGSVTFNCGTAPFTITLTQPKTISDDTSLDGGGRIALGGGDRVPILVVDPGVMLSVTGVIFGRGNSAADGGAIAGGPGSTLNVTNCRFLNNHSGGNGGAIATFGSLQVTNTTFTRNNSSATGGAIYSPGYGALSLTHSTFLQNASSSDGGAIAMPSSHATCPVDGGCALVVTDSIFRRNSTLHFGNGGAIYSEVGASVSVTGSTFSGNTGGVWGGGAIFCSSPRALTVSDSIFSGNRAQFVIAGGGAIHVQENDSIAVITVTNSTFTRNRVIIDDLYWHRQGGGAIFSDPGNQLRVINSQFSSNLVGTSFSNAFHEGTNYGGGAITAFGGGPLVVANSTFVGNQARGGGKGGGALYAADTAVQVTNSTFYRNSASFEGNGGAIATSSDGQLSVTNSTFFRNAAGPNGSGGAIALDSARAGQAVLQNTIVANSPRANCAGAAFVDGGHNLRWPATDTSCVGSVGDPKLGLLKNDAGFTRTMALKAGSAAIGAGDNAVCAAAPVNGLDQRGFIRPGAGVTNCSIGAYEYSNGPAQPTWTPTVTATPTPTPTSTPTPTNTGTPTGICGDGSFCGDGVKSGGEACDGSDLGGEICATQGFTAGTLSCTDGCRLDTSTCSGPTTVIARPLQTGQTLCDPGDGYTLGPCPGFPPGQDGELRKGLSRSYTDNGDGTITDNRTGLMWEKFSADGSIHDKDNSYDWYAAFTTKIAALNSGGGFAGYTDWRLPTVYELDTLIEEGRVPSIDPVFDTGCVAGCTVTSCSCFPIDRLHHYWSSTSAYFDSPLSTHSAWSVPDAVWAKSFRALVRAVRGGQTAISTATPAGTATPTVTPGNPLTCGGGPFCGDGVKNAAEACDSGDLGDASCESEGYTSGTLRCTASCTFDSSECNGPTMVGQVLNTGQTQCDQGAGTFGDCPGSPAGQDAPGTGVARSYTDNGDGTITDNRTGLMWEKLSDDGSIHDQDNTYSWYDAFTTKIAALNSGGGFAGYADWRLPNVAELRTIHTVTGVLSAFKTGCVPGCSVTSCSCGSPFVWSSTTVPDYGTDAWTVVDKVNKRYADYYGVRAVRGGL